jgi:chorismate mutase/prephenate dehydrogenase
MKKKTEKLDELRNSIAEIDRAFMDLLHRRMDLAAEVGHLKAGDGQPILVPEVHDRVLNRARRHAEACGVSEQVMESIFSAVMRGAIERQHQVAAELHAASGSQMLLVGGAGSMGGWFQGFVRRLGHKIDIVDPALRMLPKTEGRFTALSEIENLDPYEAILVSVPLDIGAGVLDELIERRPRGLIIEIASIKDHLHSSLLRAKEAGLQVSSLHPMFGPGKSFYEPLTFVLACLDDPREERVRIEDWLRSPNTRLVPVPFDHHDRLMGWLLGLGHLSGMIFGLALTHSGLGAEELKACASTTYDRQLSTATSVLQEDPDLYFDIQSMNPHRGEVYKAVREAVGDLVDAVQSGDRQQFREVLATASRFVSTH